MRYRNNYDWMLFLKSLTPFLKFEPMSLDLLSQHSIGLTPIPRLFRYTAYYIDRECYIKVTTFISCNVCAIFY